MEAALNAVEVLSVTEGDIPDSVWESVKKLADASYISELAFSEERPCEESDFTEILPNVTRNLKTLLFVLKKLTEVRTSGTFKCSRFVMKNSLIPLLLLCGEHNRKVKWATEETVGLASELCNLLCKLCGCQNATELLCGISSEVQQDNFKIVILALRPKLLQNTWKKHPAAVSCYSWLLPQVKSPHLSEHLNDVLPTTLMLIDDYQTEYQIIGVQCLQHIINNVTRTELCWYQRSDVIYSAIEPMLYHREPELVIPVISCMIILLQKVEAGYIKEERSYEFSRYDRVCQIVLHNMEMEQKIILRKAYAQILGPFLDAVGLSTVRWTKRLLLIFREYLEVDDGVDHTVRKHTLMALKIFLKQTWPRVSVHVEALLEMLLKLLYDLAMKLQAKPADSSEEEMLMLVEDSLLLLARISPREVNLLCSGIKTIYINDLFASVINRTLTPS